MYRASKVLEPPVHPKNKRELRLSGSDAHRTKEKKTFFWQDTTHFHSCYCNAWRAVNVYSLLALRAAVSVVVSVRDKVGLLQHRFGKLQQVLNSLQHKSHSACLFSKQKQSKERLTIINRVWSLYVHQVCRSELRKLNTVYTWSDSYVILLTTFSYCRRVGGLWLLQQCYVNLRMLVCLLQKIVSVVCRIIRQSINTVCK